MHKQKLIACMIQKIMFAEHLYIYHFPSNLFNPRPQSSWYNDCFIVLTDLETSMIRFEFNVS